MKIFGLILAGGKSERFGADKLTCQIGSETILERSARILAELKCCDEIFTVHEGETRFTSMRNGIDMILKNVRTSDFDKTYVIIHNAANPGVTESEIKACIEGAKLHGGCGVAHKIKDTVRRHEVGKSDDSESVFEILNRENLYAMQTPQCIRLDLLLRGIGLFQEMQTKNSRPSSTSFGKQASALAMTDDLQLLDLLNRNSDQKINYTLIEASESNFKITTKDDLKKMRAVLGIEQRVGVGQDSHEFSDAGFLTLGGVKFENLPKLEANSDGDVILHALFNAISSALGGSSLGQTADKMCAEGVKDSREYLNTVLSKMRLQGYEIGNLSISLICKKPKIDLIESDLKKSLGEILNLAKDKIGITATSGEGMPNTEIGVQCTCFVTLT